jgi:serine/threonine protein kinase
MDPTNLTPTGDQYSLGCVMYYMLAGRYPFADGSAAEKMMAHQFKEPDSLAELAPETPPELLAVVEKLMQKKPENRFTAVGQVVEELRPYVRRQSGNLPRPQMKHGQSSRPASAASIGGAPPKSVSPSAPTPRPQAMGSLPTRSTLRGGQSAAAKPKPHPQTAPSPAEPIAPVAVPGGSEDVEETKSNWDSFMGPIGIVSTALLACVLGFLAFKFFS